jgi:hypothetical protein
MQWIIKFNAVKPCPCLLYKIATATTATVNRFLTSPNFEFTDDAADHA